MPEPKANAFLVAGEDILRRQPRFLWYRVGYYQITKSSAGTCFHFDRFPNKAPIVVRWLLLLCVVAALAAWFAVRVRPPLFAIVAPALFVFCFVAIRDHFWPVDFTRARIEIDGNRCVVYSTTGVFEVNPLLKVVLHNRSKTREGRPCGDPAEEELFLASQTSEGGQVYFPLEPG